MSLKKKELSDLVEKFRKSVTKPEEKEEKKEE